MTIRIIHSADWHLGHQLHGFNREHEHQEFLNWLIELIKDQQADALVVAGDLFDTANPPASAWKMLYHFLARLYKEMPSLDVILLGGNHDSPSKLDAPHDLLKAFDLNMIGAISRNDHLLNTDQLLLPIKNKTSQIEAWVLAVPFLRTSDLKLNEIADADDKLISGVELVYQEVLEKAKEKQQQGQALIATGHLYMASTELSELSERRILGGNQHALPSSIFDESIDYIALGHLHKAQIVAKQDRIRYSGSPIPLSMTERHYKHQVLVVEFENGKLSQIESHFIPRTVDLIRKPEHALPLEETLQILKDWQPDELEKYCQPIVEIPVLLDAPQPQLKEKILKVLESKPIRIAKISPQYSAVEKKEFNTKQLSEVSPLDVFNFSWKQKFADEPSKDMIEKFNLLLDETLQYQGDEE